MSEQAGSERKANGAAGPSVREADGPARRFLAGVREALADLPATEVEEILDDVRSHLSELADELGDALTDRALADRLGTPAAYAAELRAAAGYPAPPTPEPPAGHRAVLAGLAVAGLVLSPLIPIGLVIGSEVAVLFGVLGVLAALPALITGGPGMTAVAELPGVGSLFGPRPLPDGPAGRFVADLQLAWWVVRALVAAVVTAWVFGGSWPAVLPAALVAVPVSIWLGRFGRRDRRLLWLVVPLNVVAVIAMVLVLVRIEPQPASDSSSTYSSGLWQDGREVRDIRPVDSAGVPLTGVYLFDQDGRPIDTLNNRCESSTYYDTSGGTSYYDAEGNRAGGSFQAYPRGTVEYGSPSGGCVVVPPGPLVVAVPTPTTGPTTGTAPTAGSTASAAPATGATGAPTPEMPTPGAPTPAVPPSAVPPTR